MISNLKRILIFALIFSMLACALSSCATPQEPHETDTECEMIETTSEVPMKKTLDIYLVAGQSNATGCTKVTDLGTVYDFYPDLVSGVSNVLYAGNSRANGTNPKDRVLGWQETMYLACRKITSDLRQVWQRLCQNITISKRVSMRA